MDEPTRERAQQPAVQTYQIDPARSAVQFRVRHLGITNVTGRFTRLGGTIRFDPEDLSTVTASIAIQAASVDTGNGERDDRLRSEDLLGAARYPEITFESTETGSVDVNAFKMAGDLTIRDVTRPVVLEATYLGSARDDDGRRRALFEAHTAIDRESFDMAWSQALKMRSRLVGEEVKVVLEIQAVEAGA